MLYIIVKGGQILSMNEGDISIKEISKIDETICSSAFSSLGVVSLGAKNGDIFMVDISGHEILGVLTGHLDQITALKFSMDGHTLYSGSFDLSVRVWNVYSSSQKGIFSGHRYPISAIDLSADEKVLASGSCGMRYSSDNRTFSIGAFDFSLRLWDTRTHLELHNFSGCHQHIAGLAFHPSKNVLFTSNLSASDATSMGLIMRGYVFCDTIGYFWRPGHAILGYKDICQ